MEASSFSVRKSNDESRRDHTRLDHRKSDQFRLVDVVMHVSWANVNDE